MYLTAKTYNDFITNLQIDFPQIQEEVRFVMTTKNPISKQVVLRQYFGTKKGRK